jgi:hypothetical protein
VPPPDAESYEYANQIYKSSDLLGTFEVVEIGPFTGGGVRAAGRYYEDIKLKPIEIFKGKVDGFHIHHYVGVNNGSPRVFKSGNKYLMAFSDLDSKGESRNGMCTSPVYFEMKKSKTLMGNLKKIKIEK